MSGFSMFPPGMKFLLASNIGIFLAELFFGPFRIAGILFPDWVDLHFSLWPLNTPFFMPWQLLTYMFLHEGFWHIAVNMFVLWMFGFQIEHLWGTKRFLIYYFVCGLGGAVSHMFLSSALGIEAGPMLGASAAIFGVLVAFGVLFPNQLIYIYFLVPIRAKWVVIGWIAIEVFSLYGANDHVAHLAHLGGALTGMIYLLIMSGGTLLAGRMKRGVSSQWSNPSGGPATRNGGGMFGRTRAKREAVDAEYRDLTESAHASAASNAPNVKQARVITQEEIDRILDKIAATGYQNLTEDERDILFEASRRMEEKR